MQLPRTRYTRAIWIIPTLAAAAAAIVPRTSHAVDIIGGLVTIGASTIGMVMSIVLYALNYVATLLFNLAAFFATYFLSLNYEVVADTNRIATIGWGICRDVANLGLVLLLVLIAIATIVRMKEYTAKSALPKLIAAAIIVNFSFAIAQIFIDFSHSITRYFFSAVTAQSDASVTATIDAIGGAFNPQKLFSESRVPEPVDPAEESYTDTLSTAILIKVASLAFSLIFTLIAAFTLLAFAVILIIRYVWLTILLVLSPLAWLSYAFPGLSGQYGKWWSKFIQWVFFAPVVSFFFYLAIVAANQMGSLPFPNAEGYVSGGSLAMIISQGAQMFVLAGFLLGGLMAGQALGVGAAGGALKLAGRAKDSATKWAGAKTKGGVASLRNRAVTAGTNAEGKTGLERLSARYGKIPLVGRALTGLSGVSSSTKAEMAKSATKKADELGHRTKEDLVTMSNRLTPAASSETVAAHALATAKAGGWDDLTPAMQARATQAIRQTGSSDKILGYVPQLATEFEGKKMLKTGKVDPRTGKDIEVQETDAQYRSRLTTDRDKIISAAVRSKVKDAGDLADSALKDPSVIRALSARHISQLADIEIEDKVTIKNTIEADIGTNNMQRIDEYRRNINDYVKQIDEARMLGKAGEQKVKDALYVKKGFESNLKSLTDKLTDNQKEALRVRDTMADNIAYNDVFPKGSGKKKP
jgi:hypothetical protein